MHLHGKQLHTQPPRHLENHIYSSIKINGNPIFRLGITNPNLHVRIHNLKFRWRNINSTTQMGSLQTNVLNIGVVGIGI